MSVRAVQGGTGRVRTGRVGAQAGRNGPSGANGILLENGLDFLMMEDDASFLLLEA